MYHSYSNWFEKLFGFVEKEVMHTKMREMFEYNYNTSMLYSKSNKRTFIAGKFETPTLGDLRKRFDLTDITKNNPILQGSIRVKQISVDVTD